MSEGKKGLSTIVAAIIIILLVLVAIGVIWVVVRNLISEGSEQISLGKFTLDLKIEQVQISETQAQIKVKRNSGSGEFVKLKFLIDDGENVEIVEREASLKELESRTFTLDLNEVNGDDIKKIDIAPVFKLESGKEVSGDVKDSYEVSGKEVEVSECSYTCSSLQFECGMQSVCGVLTNCGSCSNGLVCSSGTCVNQTSNDSNSVCMNGMVEGNEECDDGNTANLDGCTTVCEIEQGWSCTGSPSECIQEIVCGDNLAEEYEICDGTDLNGETCESQIGPGYTGNLGCEFDCTSYDTSNCEAPVVGQEGNYTGESFSTSSSGNTNIRGITNDGTYIWTSDYSEDKVYKYFINGTYTGESFDLAGNGNTVPRGLTNDGTYIWVIDDEDDLIYKYNFDGSFTGETIDISGVSTFDSFGQLFLDGNFFWITEYNDDEVYKFNIDGTYTGESFDLSVSGNNDPKGITGNGNFFWITDQDDQEVYKYFINGTYTGKRFDLSSTDNTLPLGITNDGTYFYIVDNSVNKIRKHYM